MQKNGTVIIIEDFMQSELSLRGTALLVYAIIWSFCKLKGSFFAAVSYLAKRCYASERAVQYALRRLTELGYVECKGKHELFATNIYECTRKVLPEGTDECGTSVGKSTETGVSITPVANTCGGIACGSTETREEIYTDPARETCIVEQAYTPAVKNAEPATEFGRAVAKECGLDKPFGARGAIPKRRTDIYERDISAYYENYFHNYGIDDLVRLTPKQYEILESWVGENTLECYILRLECCLRDIPGFRSFSHYKTIKAWLAEDMEA